MYYAIIYIYIYVMDICLIPDKIERLFTTIGVEFYVLHLVWVAVCIYIYTYEAGSYRNQNASG